MFGDVWIELEPNPAAGVEFADKVVGGSVPKGFFAGIEKGIRETAAEGVLAGFPLIDFKATLYDGSFHPVDSNELSFKIAASMALKDGVMQAKPVLLEPIMTVEVRIPEQYMGEVNRDLNGRRGRVLGMDLADGMQVITRARPAGRAVLVRDRAALAHRRARDVQLRARPLRGRAGAPRREDHRGAQEGARRGALSRADAPAENGRLAPPVLRRLATAGVARPAVALDAAVQASGRSPPSSTSISARRSTRPS